LNEEGLGEVVIKLRNDVEKLIIIYQHPFSILPSTEGRKRIEVSYLIENAITNA
jgi:hypothetical protein